MRLEIIQKWQICFCFLVTIMTDNKIFTHQTIQNGIKQAKATEHKTLQRTIFTVYLYSNRCFDVEQSSFKFVIPFIIIDIIIVQIRRSKSY